MSSAINQTIQKFGYPSTLLREFDYWAILLRPKQVTLASVVLACKEGGSALPDLSPQAFAELKRASGEMETTLRSIFRVDRINYLMLMMVDPQVHFHVIPRYSSPQEFGGMEFVDPGWPKHPNMLHEHPVSPAVFNSLRKRISDGWISII